MSLTLPLGAVVVGTVMASHVFVNSRACLLLAVYLLGFASTALASECGTPPVPANDNDGGILLSPTRLLRRASLLLTGRPPVMEQVDAVLQAGDGGYQLVDKAVDEMMNDPQFYDELYDFGREWLMLNAAEGIGDEPGYRLASQRNIVQCPTGSQFEGAWAENAYMANDAGVMVNYPCDGHERDGSPATTKMMEPWWAPGTTVQIVGRKGNEAPTVTVGVKVYDCALLQHSPSGMDPTPAACGCGTNLRYCRPSPSVGWANWWIYLKENPTAQRRLAWEEPARLVAHVGWHDRPMSDLILGDYSVGPVELQVAYVATARRIGRLELDSDDSWWRPNLFTGAVDPRHDATDPWAWREFQVAKRNPLLLADRNYKFDPRTEPRGSIKGIPAAGVLTTFGVLEGYPRERLRAARMMEAFACDEFVPPPAHQQFNAYDGDPAISGPCQHCHARLDPAAVHFKRWNYVNNLEVHGVLPIGRLNFPDAWTQGQFPYKNGPFLHWVQWWKPETIMTPVSKSVATANPEARFIDFLVPEQTLYGQQSDGTVGPLGMAKLLVSSGTFDRCMVRRLHERFAGRALDPGTEAGYIEQLTQHFVASGRKVRPFLRTLFQTEAMRRGL